MLKPYWRAIMKSTILMSPITSQPYSSYFKPSIKILALLYSSLGQGKRWINIPVMKPRVIEAPGRGVDKGAALAGFRGD